MDDFQNKETHENIIHDSYKVFQNYSRALTLFSKDGVMINMNRAAMSLYGITDIQKFKSLNIKFSDDPNYQKELDPSKYANDGIKIKYRYDFDALNKAFPGLTSKRGVMTATLYLENIYDDQGDIENILCETVDVSKEEHKKDTAEMMSESLTVLASTQSISIWALDIKTDIRELISGSHLYPQFRTMNEYMTHVHPDDVGMLHDCITQILYKNKAEADLTIRFQDTVNEGEYLVFSVFCIAQIKEGELVSIAVMTKDITEKEHIKHRLMEKEKELSASLMSLEKTNAMLSLLIDRMPCVFFMKDVEDDFRYIMVNDVFCHIFGKERHEVIGLTDNDLFKSREDVKYFRKNDIQAISEGHMSFVEELAVTGERHIWHTSKYRLKSADGSIYLVGLGQDITWMDDANRELTLAKEKAEKLDTMKSAFLANISHEIRTPLNSILGFSSILVSADDPAERQRFNQIITSNGKMLLTIIEDMIILSRFDANDIYPNRETFDLPEFLSNIRNTYSLGTSGDVALLCSLPHKSHTIKADKHFLGQVIYHYLSNSIKYTRKGKITIGYHLDGDTTLVYVQDTGIGIAEKDWPKIFSRFDKVDEFAQGAGLGLSICKAIADHFGCKVGFESEYGKGSRFWVRIPIW